MQIETKIPMPATRSRYPFKEMKVGESVFFPNAATGGKEYIAANMIGRNHGKKFSGRAVDGGLRIWRVE